MRILLSRVTPLRPIACGIAAGHVLIRVLALVGGPYDKRVIHDPLAPPKIFVPKTQAAGLLPHLQKYAGQQVLTGAQAQAYANKFINRHLAVIGGGRTYSRISAG